MHPASAHTMSPFINISHNSKSSYTHSIVFSKTQPSHPQTVQPLKVPISTIIDFHYAFNDFHTYGEYLLNSEAGALVDILYNSSVCYCW